MCVYVCACMYLCVYVCACLCVCVSIGVCVYMFAWVSIHLDSSTHTHVLEVGVH